MYVSNKRMAKYMKQKTKQKGKMDNLTIAVGNFNNHLSTSGGTTRQKSSKDTGELNYTIKQKDLIDMNKTFHPTTPLYTFFSSTHRIYIKMD